MFYFFLYIFPLLIFPLFFFFFNDTATTEIYTLSLHDALPIWRQNYAPSIACGHQTHCRQPPDRKSTRLNSSHSSISYAVFCLKKKNESDPVRLLLLGAIGTQRLPQRRRCV